MAAALLLALSLAAAAPASAAAAEPSVSLVLLGHVDHGKTTLAAAISSLQASRGKAEYSRYADLANAPREERGGLELAVSRVEFATAARHYLLADPPTHADLVKALLSGAVAPQGAILVVSAADGPMPQTREQIRLAGQLGVPTIVVFLNKCDLVDDQELLQLVELEVRELLSAYGYPGDETPIVRGSALQVLVSAEEKWARGIDELLAAIDHAVRAAPAARATPGPAAAGTAFQAEIYLLAAEESDQAGPLRSGDPRQFSFGDTDVTGVALLPEGVEEGKPGENFGVTVELYGSVPLARGLRFAIRQGGRVVGAGVVTEP